IAADARGIKRRGARNFPCSFCLIRVIMPGWGHAFRARRVESQCRPPHGARLMGRRPMRTHTLSRWILGSLLLFAAPAGAAVLTFSGALPSSFTVTQQTILHGYYVG